MDPADVMRRLADAVQRRDAEALAALYAQDAVLHHPLAPAPLVGREAIRQSEQALFDAFSDIEVAIKTLLADDRRCGCELVGWSAAAVLFWSAQVDRRRRRSCRDQDCAWPWMADWSWLGAPGI